MAEDLHLELIDPHALSPAALAALQTDLYAIHCEIFDGVDLESFTRYVVLSPAQETRIAHFKAASGESAGYVAMHFFERELEGRPCTVLRMEMGFRRAWRGSLRGGPFIARTVLARLAQHPGRRLFFLACPVHPASYVAVARRATACWPRHDQPTPPDIERFMLQLADDFGLETIDPAQPMIRDVGWITRQSEVEVEYWKSCESPEARFYLRSNPGYVQGHGLLVFMPLEPHLFADMLRRWIGEQAARRGRQVRARLQRFTRGSPIDADACALILGRSPLFTGTDPAARRALAEEARVVIVPAGEWVFRQGDRGDAMFIILRGSAYVYQEEDDGEDEPDLIDQLGVGDTFGDIALITGGPRNAGIRAAADLRLLRITLISLRALLRAWPTAAAPLWHNVALLRFDNFARDLPELHGLARARRLDWFEGGRDADPGPIPGDDACIFAYEGTWELSCHGVRCALTAPALVSPAPGLTLTPHDDARAWILPATVPVTAPLP